MASRVRVVRGASREEGRDRASMKFPAGNFGSFGGGLRRYADRDGNIPSNGADFGSMNYSPMWTPDDGEWAEFVADAVEATGEAEETQSTHARGG